MRAKRGTWISVAAVLGAFALIAGVAVTTIHGRKRAASQGASRSRRTAESSGAWNLFVLDIRKRAPVRLTRNEEEEFTLDPAWQPGPKIAYSQANCEGCPSSLLVIDPHSGATTRVRSHPGGFIDPAWAPGGKKLAVARSGEGLYLVDLQKETARRITRGRTDDRPTWSPDGRRIAFERQVSPTNWDIYVVSPGRGGPHPLIRTAAQETSASWSPDGSRIAFARQGTNGNWTIHVIRPDGSRDRTLTDPRRSSQEPAWSPGGSRIAYLDQSGGGGSVMVMSAHGGRPSRLTANSMQANRPTWSPDGSRIAFAARR